MKKKITLAFILLLTLLGMSLSLFLTDYHYKLAAEQEVVHTAVCSLSSSFNCDLVNTSKYSVLFGVPIALFGFFFYLILFVLASMSLKAALESKISFVLHILAIGSILYSAYLFYIAKFVIGALCPYCIMLYSINIGLLIATKIFFGKNYSQSWQEICTLVFRKKD